MNNDDDIRSGNSEMDSEHQVQISLMHALERSLAQGRGKSDISSILNQLVEYTNIHFMSEQLLMRLHAYPDFGAHEMEHDHLIEQLRKVEAGFAAGDSDMTAAEIAMLQRLVVDHIQTHDRAFSAYLADAAVGSAAGA